MKKSIAFLFVLSSVVTSFGQNLDLINDKEFPELNKLNPSLTGVLNQFRGLANAASNTDLGLETRLFKSVNYLGFTATFDETDHLNRQVYTLGYARDITKNDHLKIKLGLNADYHIKVFHNDNQLNTDFTFADFNGFRYDVDSLNINDFSVESQVFDLDIGASVLFKNLLLGITVNHINRPDISVQKGVEQLMDLSYNAQLMGFVKLGELLTIIPTGVYARQQDDVFSSYGVSLNRNTWTFTGQYEALNDQIGYDFGLTKRFKKRYLLNISYRSNLATENTKDGYLSATVNATLFKPKKELEGILDKLKAVY